MTSSIDRLAPEMRRVLDRLLEEDGLRPDPTMLPAADGRNQSEVSNLRWNTGEPAMASVRDVSREVGFDATVYVPTNDEGRNAIFYIHGGGWSFCSSRTHDGAARQLAQATRAPVVTFDYRLAPENPYPAGLEDCMAVWAMRADLLADRKWSLAGDSAGANLAVAAMLRLIAAGATAELPASGLLFYGVFDADFDSPSYREIADGPGLTRDKMRRYWNFYAPDTDRLADPFLCPARAPDSLLSALPPVYLNAAEIDPLRSDSEALHRRLTSLGRNDQLDVVPGVVHGFMQMSLWLRQSSAAYVRAGEVFQGLMQGAGSQS